jgi:hypothetical protein
MDKIIRPIHRENVCFRRRRSDVKISKRKASTDFQIKDSTSIVTWLLSPRPSPENRYDPALLPAWGAIFPSD